jgi:peptide/nickel transport system ATP-binding protein
MTLKREAADTENTQTGPMVLSLSRVTKSFGRSNGTAHAQVLRVIDDLSFTFKAGAIVGLIGRTGVGKTTLGKIMGGLLRSDFGVVALGEVDLQKCTPREMRGLRRWLHYVPQNPDAVVSPHITVSEALREGRQNTRLDSDAQTQWLGMLQQTVMYKHSWAKRFVGNLSLGERRRIVNLRSLQACPRFIIFDEPFNGLDLVSKHGMLSFLQTAAHHWQMGVFIISHDVEALAEVCDEVWQLEAGKFAQRMH